MKTMTRKASSLLRLSPQRGDNLEVAVRRDDETAAVKTTHLASFMSEHTAEYALVPDLVRRLSPHFHAIMPMFFWSTREGNAAARKRMSNSRVQLLTAFPRRPKVSKTDENRITMKVNQELLSYARVSVAAGVPVLAGIPLVSSLVSFGIQSPCCWFDLVEFVSADRDCFVTITLNGTISPDRSSGEFSPQPLDDSQIFAAVSRSAKLGWDDAVETLRRIRYMTPESGRFSFFGGYKPFHFVFPTQ
jgi:hypothetical protein